MSKQKLSSRYVMIADIGLHLYDYGEIDGKEHHRTEIDIVRKFRRTFRRVWKILPEEDRSTLLQFWTSRHDGCLGVRIAVAGVWHPHLTHRMAACAGGEFVFNNEWIRLLNSVELATLIAHELGHGISYPHGWFKQHKCLAYQGLECVACECRAHSYMAAWGFDPFLGRLPKKKYLVERFPPRGRFLKSW